MKLLILSVVGGLCSLLSCAERNASDFIVEIGDRGYSQDDFDRYLLESLPRDEPALRAELKSALFDEFIEERLLTRSAFEEGITISDDELRRELGQQSIDLTDAENTSRRTRVQDSLSIRRLLETRVLGAVSVQDDEISAHYDSRRTFFRRSEVVEVSQVLVEDEDHAAKLRSLLVAEPQRFEETARKESVGPEASREGQMGSFTRGQLPPSFEEVIFDLPVGQVSRVVTTDYGFHIFRVTRKTPSRELTLEDVADAIRVELLRKKSDAAMIDYVAELRLSYPVTIHIDRLNFNYVDSSLSGRENSGAESVPIQ